MKIIYCAEVRGEFARIYSLLKETIAGTYIFSGNLVDMPFYSPERYNRFIELQERLRSYVDPSAVTCSAEELAELVIADNSYDNSAHSDALELLELSGNAVNTMLKKYARFEVILSTKPYAPVHVIPGCSDLSLRNTALAGRNGDLSVFTAGNINIACVGGADAGIPGFPERDAVGRCRQQDRMIPEFLEKNSVNFVAGAIPCRTHPEYNPGPFSLLSGYCVKRSLPLMLCGNSDEFIAPWLSGDTVHVAVPAFGEFRGNATAGRDGGFFYEILFNDESVKKLTLKKIVTDRIHDIAEYTPGKGSIAASIIDDARFEALKAGEPYDGNTLRASVSPELKLFRDIKNFFRIYQTEETERKVETLAVALETLGDEYRDIALDLVGSTNIGIAQKGSDVDMVLYIRGGDMCLDDDEICSRFDEVEQRIRDVVGDSCSFELIDRVNLDLVEESIRNRDCESPVLQRFVVYRGMCRPVNYRVIAPVEDMLNADELLRREAERSMSEYLQVFGTTKDTNRSFDKYLTRLKTMGVEIPQVVADKIRMFLQKA